MRQILAARSDGRFAEASGLLKSLLVNPTATLSEKQWAVRQLLAISQMIVHPDLSTYLISLLSQQSELTRAIRSVLPGSHLHEGSIAQAIEAFNTIIQSYPHTDLERSALYGKFALALFNGRDTAQARSLYSQLKADYQHNLETFIAGIELRNYQTALMRTSAGGPNIAGKIASSKTEGGQQTPREFKLAQNYPNPFNPSTTIQYELPKDVHVTFKLFDVLGREVMTLVDEEEKAGYHSASLNASTLASGVYFYRLTAGTFVDTRKMLVIK
jgi:hypothetical protein